MKPNDNGTAGSVLQTSSGTTNNSNVSTTAGSLTNGGTAGNKSNADLSLSLQQTGSSRTASREDDDQQQVDGDDANQQNPGKMFIGGLSWNTTAEGLRDYFSKFGEVNECIVRLNYPPICPFNYKKLDLPRASKMASNPKRMKVDVEAPKAEIADPIELSVGKLDRIQINKTNANRAKLYIRRDKKKWQDTGIGHVACVQYPEDSSEWYLIVKLESNENNVLETRIHSETIYQKIEDKKQIIWSGSNTCDLALAFQDESGCATIWDWIRRIQREQLIQEVIDSAPKAKTSTPIKIYAGSVYVLVQTDLNFGSNRQRMYSVEYGGLSFDELWQRMRYHRSTSGRFHNRGDLRMLEVMTFSGTDPMYVFIQVAAAEAVLHLHPRWYNKNFVYAPGCGMQFLDRLASELANDLNFQSTILNALLDKLEKANYVAEPNFQYLFDAAANQVIVLDDESNPDPNHSMVVRRVGRKAKIRRDCRACKQPFDMTGPKNWICDKTECQERKCLHCGEERVIIRGTMCETCLSFGSVKMFVRKCRSCNERIETSDKNKWICDEAECQERKCLHCNDDRVINRDGKCEYCRKHEGNIKKAAEMAAQFSSDVEQNTDPYDLSTHLTEDFYKNLNETKKWSISRNAMLEIIEAINRNPNLIPKEVELHALIDKLSWFIESGTVNLTPFAAQTLAKVARGAPTVFKEKAPTIISICLQRAKDKKPTIDFACSVCLDAAYSTMNFGEFIGSIVGGLKLHSTDSKIQACEFFTRVMLTEDEQVIGGWIDELEDVIDLLCKLVLGRNDVCREPAMRSLAAFMRAGSKEETLSMLKAVSSDPEKMAKINEFYDQFIAEHPIEDE